MRAVVPKRAKTDEVGPGEWQGGVLSKRRIVNRWRYLPDGAIEMQLNHGATTIFDAEDLDIVTQHKWHLMTRSGYAHSSSGTGLYMHRFLMQTPKHLHTDHIDRDKLNNRRSNLRKVSRTENQRNMNGLKRNTSGQHGIDEVQCFYFSFMEGKKRRKVVVSYSPLKRGSREDAYRRISEKHKAISTPGSILKRSYFQVRISIKSADGARKSFPFNSRVSGDRRRAFDEATQFRDAVQARIGSTNGKPATKT